MAETPPPLIRDLARGRPAAFAELYARYGAGIYRYLLAATGHRETAEDLLQAVWLRLVRYRRRLRNVENLRGYLFAVARNELRRTPRGEPAGGPVPEGAAAPGSDGEDEAGLRAALRALPQEQRHVVELKVWHQLTFAEIGTLLAVSPNTAASRYRLALTALARRLEEKVHVAG